MSFKRTGGFLLLFLTLPLCLYALKIPARPLGYVSDFAGLMSPAVKANLEGQLRSFESQTSNQIVVATFPSLEEESLEDFSIRLAEQWKVGQKGKDNGAILLIFKNDRKVRIEVGYGLEGVLPDAICKLIIESEITPRFRQGRFDEGIQRAVEAMMAATKNEYRATASSSTENFVSLFLFIFFMGLLPFFYRFLLKNSRGYTSMSRRGIYSSGGYWGGGGFGGGGFSGGGGGFGGGGASGGW